MNIWIVKYLEHVRREIPITPLESAYGTITQQRGEMQKLERTISVIALDAAIAADEAERHLIREKTANTFSIVSTRTAERPLSQEVLSELTIREASRQAKVQTLIGL